MQYGRITATIQPPKANGAVTAFIFKADNKDEIDYELVQGRKLKMAHAYIYTINIFSLIT